MKQFSLPRGTADILPEEVVFWRRLEESSRDFISRYGYKEIRTPVFEETGLFARSIGQTSDVVQKQMLNLAAQNLEAAGEAALSGLSLRPEGTAAVVRAYIEHRLDKQEPLSKLFYICPMFRGERPQKGRLRQFHQIGVEAVGPGTASPFLDAELIGLSVDLLEYLGIKNFQLRLNTLGDKDDKERFSATLKEAFRTRVGKLCDDCRQRYERNVFRLLDCKNPDCKKLVASLDIDASYLSPESRSYFQEVCRLLTSLNIPYQVNPTMVRGLDYYTHTVFEIVNPALGSQDALGAGGRYNNLVQDLGGPQADAVGFALGIERMILSLPDGGGVTPPGVDVFIAALDHEGYAEALLLAQGLRGQGFSCETNFRPASLKSMLRQANKALARHVIILGEEELKVKSLTLKQMQTGQQQTIGLHDRERLLEALAGQRKG